MAFIPLATFGTESDTRARVPSPRASIAVGALAAAEPEILMPTYGKPSPTSSRPAPRHKRAGAWRSKKPRNR